MRILLRPDVARVQNLRVDEARASRIARLSVSKRRRRWIGHWVCPAPEDVAHDIPPRQSHKRDRLEPGLSVPSSATLPPLSSRGSVDSAPPHRPFRRGR